MPSLQATFDRVVVVNLARRPERLASFWRTLGDDWPFRRPERFEAVDGRDCPPPPEWKQGAGAWGCMSSHRQVLRSAVADDVGSILILEDDALPVPAFAERVGPFLDRVPADWDCLMLGGKHLRPPTPVVPGVARCVVTTLTHAFALRGPFIAGLLRMFESVTDDHCDIALAACQRHVRAYAPAPFLMGQAGSFSDISLIDEPDRFYADDRPLARSAPPTAVMAAA